MSHELRTPLNAVLGFSELLQLNLVTEKTGEYARLIHDSGSHLLSLINDILDLSKIEAGKFELRETEVDLAKLIAECITALAPKAAAGQIRMTYDTGDSAPRILADQRAMRQILLNLISNSVKFTGNGGRIHAIAIVLPTGELSISIRDTGIGMSDEDQARVFESFGQGRHDIALTDKGTGLGLPIVKGLVEAHGGSIAIESKVSVGTTVTVMLPRERVIELARAG
jgi:two-component system cell cycle sensor histidine kinase PleC